MTLRFLEKKSVGTAQIEQAPGRAKATDKVDAMREFAPQHRLATLIVQISVAALTREIAGGIIGVGVKTAGFRVTQTTPFALPDSTSTDVEAKRVRSGFATGGAGLAGHRGSDYNRVLDPKAQDPKAQDPKAQVGGFLEPLA